MTPEILEKRRDKKIFTNLLPFIPSKNSNDLTSSHFTGSQLLNNSIFKENSDSDIGLPQSTSPLRKRILKNTNITPNMTSVLNRNKYLSSRNSTGESSPTEDPYLPNKDGFNLPLAYKKLNQEKILKKNVLKLLEFEPKRHSLSPKKKEKNLVPLSKLKSFL